MEKKIGYKDIIKQKEYMKFISAGIINRFGDSIDAIAFTWLVYQISGSASLSAIIFGLNRIPTIFITPLAGAYVDKVDKKKILVITDIIRGVIVGLVALGYIFEFVNVPMLMVATVIISTAESFRTPSAGSITPQVLDESHYTFGLSLSTSAQTVSELIGTGLAALIIAVLGIGGAILIDMATFFLSALIIATIKLKPITITEHTESQSILESLKDGFKTVRSSQIIWFAICCAVFLNGIFVPLNSLQAPLVSEVLFSNETMLAVLGIGFTTGSLVGAFIFPYIAEKFTMRFYLLSTFILNGIALLIMVPIGLVSNETFKMILVWMTFFISSIFVAFLNSYTMVFILKRTPQQYLARVTGLLNALCQASVPVVSIGLGLLANYVTTAQIFMGCGALCLLAILYYGQKRHYVEIDQKPLYPEPEIIIENS